MLETTIGNFSAFYMPICLTTNAQPMQADAAPRTAVQTNAQSATAPRLLPFSIIYIRKGIKKVTYIF